ncbi:hypothetical protein BQ8482_340091 [Mesorhizobium delmotii]|uniref:Uncharacterized protein n=1 Tax=Mesorhizobium delmotii TaxID=1631247 RepID=A0A2P9APX2_9HYPH|nr:hypothetical protein BQ8482_340091 [Mesorhizobium delmotii]
MTAKDAVDVMDVTLRCDHVTSNYVQLPLQFGNILSKFSIRGANASGAHTSTRSWLPSYTLRHNLR